MSPVMTIVATKTFPSSKGFIHPGRKVVLPTDEAQSRVAGGFARFVKVMAPVETKETKPAPVKPGPTPSPEIKVDKKTESEKDRKKASGSDSDKK